MGKYRFLKGPPSFDKSLQDILKKFNLKEKELRKEASDLISNPYKAPPIANYPAFRKLRMKIPGLIGKRGGLRFIYYIEEQEKVIIPILIYFKGDKEDLSPKDLEKLKLELKKILEQRRPRK